MPNIMIHEKVAYTIAKQIKDLDTKEFYLGALSPDAVNVNGFASKEERWTSHIRDKDLNMRSTVHDTVMTELYKRLTVE